MSCREVVASQTSTNEVFAEVAPSGSKSGRVLCEREEALGVVDDVLELGAEAESGRALNV